MKPTLYFLKNGFVFIPPKSLRKKLKFSGSYPYLDYLAPLGWHKHTRMLTDLLPNPNVIKVTTLHKTELIRRVSQNTNLLGKNIEMIASDFYLTESLNIKDLLLTSIASGQDLTQIDTLFIVLNFWNIQLVYLEPITIGDSITYSINSYQIKLPDLKQTLFSYLRELYSTITQNITLKELKTLLYNMDNFIPLRTSSVMIADVIRAISTIGMSQLTPLLRIKKAKTGRIILTGEIPYFLGGYNDLVVSLTDALLLPGIWDIIIDRDFSILTALMTNIERSQKLELPSKHHILYIHSEKPREIQLIFNDNSTHKLLMAPNDIHIHKINVPLQSVSLGSEYTAPKLKYNFPKGIKIIVDSRKRPIAYGPTYAENTTAKIFITKLNA